MEYGVGIEIQYGRGHQQGVSIPLKFLNQ